MIKFAILGLVQGFTEFLPVSSSGHLVIVQRLFGLSNSIAFDITVHLATLLAVIVYFWHDIIDLIFSFFKGIISPRKAYIEDPLFKLGLLILVSTVITAVIGFSFSDLFESMFSNIKSVGGFLMLTGIIILLAEKFSKPEKNTKDLGLLDSIVVGFAQAAAIAPGLSRSGTTISASLFRGMNRELAARYSFILSVPTILGAGLFEVKKVFAAGAVPGGLNALIIGAVAAFLSGLVAISIFMNIIKKTKISVFAYYCLIVGVLTLILL